MFHDTWKHIPLSPPAPTDPAAPCGVLQHAPTLTRLRWGREALAG
ncbi:hypothetical protein [Chloroflexus sp.]|nr:hypothetical protein [Chloroflexus sp.]